MASAFMSKVGIDNIVLQFDKVPAIYKGGEDLSGRIIVVCDETTPVKGIKVQLTTHQ